nr:hypothetical protein [Tanacetum cinerariifolium]
MRHGFNLGYKTWVHHGEPALPPSPAVIDNTRQPQMSDMTALLNDLSYISSNSEHNEPTQGDIGETSSEPTQATRNEFEELYASANEELYPGCDYVTRLDFMAKFIYFNVKGNDLACYGKGTEPGKMQHPVDGRAWKNFDTKYLDFAKEPRNVRLGLAADGFNPEFFMLTLLIPGPKSPGKDIDVYLRPLIEGLKKFNMDRQISLMLLTKTMILLMIDTLPHDLADSDNEDLINVDDDGVDKVYSSEEED